MFICEKRMEACRMILEKPRWHKVTGQIRGSDNFQLVRCFIIHTRHVRYGGNENKCYFFLYPFFRFFVSLLFFAIRINVLAKKISFSPRNRTFLVRKFLPYYNFVKLKTRYKKEYERTLMKSVIFINMHNEKVHFCSVINLFSAFIFGEK